MVPPISDEGRIELSKPLSSWQRDGAFDVGSACRHAIDIELTCDAAIYEGTAQEINQACNFAPGTKPRTDDVMRQAAHFRMARYAHALCIATDDPRLAK